VTGCVTWQMKTELPCGGGGLHQLWHHISYAANTAVEFPPTGSRPQKGRWTPTNSPTLYLEYSPL